MGFGLDGKSCNMKNKKTIYETQTIVTENIEKTIWNIWKDLLIQI